jgi:hypothetical protein
MDLAASPGGNKIVAATTDGHIMVYDATRSQYTYDHDLRCWKPWTILLALSSSRRHDDDMSMLVATELLDFSEPGSTTYGRAPPSSTTEAALSP